MRLIDADELKRWLNGYIDTDNLSPVYMRSLIDTRSTVEAIPIEWLEDQIRAIPRDKVYFMQPKDVIENLIIQWRWEQEEENDNR